AHARALLVCVAAMSTLTRPMSLTPQWSAGRADTGGGGRVPGRGLFLTPRTIVGVHARNERDAGDALRDRLTAAGAVAFNPTLNNAPPLRGTTVLWSGSASQGVNSSLAAPRVGGLIGAGAPPAGGDTGAVAGAGVADEWHARGADDDRITTPEE